MYTKFIICLCIVVLVKAICNENDLKLIDSIEQESPCRSAGGICTIAEDCSGELTEGKGLCPKQRSKGVECCYGISIKETRCSKRGGICLSGERPCNDVVAYKNATDCPPGTTCCILVN